jgi:hypothetical protein
LSGLRGGGGALLILNKLCRRFPKLYCLQIGREISPLKSSLHCAPQRPVIWPRYAAVPGASITVIYFDTSRPAFHACVNRVEAGAGRAEKSKLSSVYDIKNTSEPSTSDHKSSRARTKEAIGDD